VVQHRVLVAVGPAMVPAHTLLLAAEASMEDRRLLTTPQLVPCAPRHQMPNASYDSTPQQSASFAKQSQVNKK